MLKKPAGPNILTALSLRFRKNQRSLFHQMVQQYGDIISLPFTGYLISRPEWIKHILVESNQVYQRNTEIENDMKAIFGDGIFVSEGNIWRRRRRLMQAAFQPQKLATYANTITTAINDLLVSWGSNTLKGAQLNLPRELSLLIQKVILNTMFSTDLSAKAEKILAADMTIGEYLIHQIHSLIKFPNFFPTPKKLRFRKAIKTIEEVLYGIINERQQSEKGKEDLLSILLYDRDEETGKMLSQREIRDEMASIFIGSSLALGGVLAWTFYFLSQNDQAEKKLVQEVREVLNGRTPTFEDIGRLKYAKMVMQETMRIYPPAAFLSRKTIKDDEIGNYRIPKNTTILVSSLAMNHHLSYWEKPEQFIPERFDEKNEINRYVYFPFGAGPHTCIGNIFSLIVGQLVIAMIVQEFKLTLPDGHPPVETSSLISSEPRYGLRMMLGKR